jgi:hypothetical protein
MSTAVTVPISITPEAQARVEELGMQQELTTLLGHTRQAVADLGFIEVTRYDDPEGEDEPRVVITAWRNSPWSLDDPTWDEWVSWYVRAFPGEVCCQFGFSVRYGNEHDR